MTTTATPGRQNAEQRKRYRQLMRRSVGVGITGLIGATSIWLLFLPEKMVLIAGLGLYYLGFIGYLLIWQRTSVTLFDEREQQIENKASGIAMNATIVVIIFGVPGDVVLATTGIASIPEFIRGAIYGYFLLTAGYLLFYGYISRQYS